ncbi:N-terminal double-transmembrane domain-containing protein [Gillisia sp. Hel1_33_143]|uniref:BatA domain-containing protein n=1 Tax=Gillisia sp. Hel1_33_143 TaxID=1336796 RepID=UPI00087B5245|nr:BatA domain-containing protein [Gillisia sp. Hel1_33_143]SDS50373.1 N-terminal double-transmembrane domain-containing protein [Gillisia sp. Hel1_33_143]
MQFRHPEILYTLFLLIIPILIHLFRLRKFQKEDFTNVKFLKEVSAKTRRSSSIKKWLILATRLLLFSSIIIAFAQPNFRSNNTVPNANTIIYLDNSYSMQANGKSGQLLESCKSQLIRFLPENKQVALITNNEIFEDVTKNEIQNISFSSNQLDLESILLNAKSITPNATSQSNLLLISDLQLSDENISLKNYDINLFKLELEKETISNIAIDTAYLSNSNPTTQTLIVKLTSYGTNGSTTSLSLYNADKLLGKSSVNFENKSDTLLQFELQNSSITKGIIKIEDNNLAFDNTLYFNINKPAPIKVISITEVEDSFLKKIYTQPQFNFISAASKNVDYNELEDAQVVILNELSEISNSLKNNLIKKAKDDVVFITIPSLKLIDSNLKTLYQNLKLPEFTSIYEKEKLITKITFQHPVFKNTFDKQISNFDYPTVKKSFIVNTNFGSPILGYEDLKPFLIALDNNYTFTAPLNIDNSNFQQSPLIVLSFYNIGLSALQPTQLYYTLGKNNIIDIPIKKSGDNILTLKTESQSFIPRQQQFEDQIKINTKEFPEQAGNYEVIYGNTVVYDISYNVDREESILNKIRLENDSKIQEIKSVPEFTKISGFTQEVDSFWKWFVTFALFFLIIETLLLKYFK